MSRDRGRRPFSLSRQAEGLGRPGEAGVFRRLAAGGQQTLKYCGGYRSSKTEASVHGNVLPARSVRPAKYLPSPGRKLPPAGSCPAPASGQGRLSARTVRAGRRRGPLEETVASLSGDPLPEGPTGEPRRIPEGSRAIFWPSATDPGAAWTATAAELDIGSAGRR